MTNKSDNKDRNPITELASIFTSDPKIAGSADFVNYDELNLVPFRELFNNGNDNKS